MPGAANHPWLQSAMHDLIEEQAATDPATDQKGNAILGSHKYLIIGEGGTIFHKPAEDPPRKPVKGVSLEALQQFQEKYKSEKIEIKCDLLVSHMFAGVEQPRSDLDHMSAADKQLLKAGLEADMSKLCYHYKEMGDAEKHLEEALRCLNDGDSVCQHQPRCADAIASELLLS